MVRPPDPEPKGACDNLEDTPLGGGYCVMERVGRAVPTGIVKWYDAEKGFGFISSDEGEDVFVHVSTLPAGVSALKPGTKLDFGTLKTRIV